MCLSFFFFASFSEKLVFAPLCCLCSFIKDEIDLYLCGSIFLFAFQFC